jgi:hypothetical protein
MLEMQAQLQFQLILEQVVFLKELMMVIEIIFGVGAVVFTLMLTLSHGLDLNLKTVLMLDK